MKHYRQGDVLFIAITNAPKATTIRKSKIIVESKRTGHAHRLSQGSVLEAEDGLYIYSDIATAVIHEEHQTLTLPPGSYKVVRQREYTPEAIREVLD